MNYDESFSEINSPLNWHFSLMSIVTLPVTTKRFNSLQPLSEESFTCQHLTRTVNRLVVVEIYFQAASHPHKLRNLIEVEARAFVGMQN